MKRKIDRFLAVTIGIDLVYLLASGFLPVPFSRSVASVLVLLFISPLVAYLVVYGIPDR